MKIGILGLKASCIIGIYPHERKKPRELLIDIELEPLSGEKSFVDKQTDSIDSTIDYEKVAKLCSSTATEGKFRLIETLAKKILEACFDSFAISRASICINKPSALKNISSAYVKLTQERRERKRVGRLKHEDEIERG